MRLAHRLIATAALAFSTTASFAAATVYTSAAAFFAHVGAGAYTETFDGLVNPASGLFSGGAFSYAATAPNDIYASGSFLGTSQVGDALTISFTSGNVMALGADFFATDISDAFQSHFLTLSFSDGTTETFTPGSLADSYRGFVFDVAISSLVIGGTAGTSLYAGLDNLTVDGPAAVSPVPEPATLALLSAGLIGLRIARRRKA